MLHEERTKLSKKTQDIKRAIDSLKDMERLFSGIPLGEVSTSMTINCTAPVALAMYLAAAEKQGVKPENIRGTLQNDILKEWAKKGGFKDFGEEKLSRPIVDAIYSARQIKKIETTKELAEIVSEVYRKCHVKSKLHPATKTFQALRIVVNSELLNLEEALPQTVSLLEKGGRLAVISFHSLEDGIVKRFFKQAARLKTLTKTPIGPGAEEIKQNPRSRSAKLRIAEKI